MKINREKLGGMCKEYRMIKGKTQAEIAETLGTTQTNISRFESGKQMNILFVIYYILYIAPMTDTAKFLEVIEHGSD